jgi:hypothetical protein
MSSKKIIILSLVGALFLAISGVGAYEVTKYINTPQLAPVQSNDPSQSSGPSIKPVAADSYCPFNGKKYTVDDQLRWEQEHPLAVMIENHPDARPQSGLTNADVVYEAVAEGGITRFMAVFLCEEPPQFVGPVRSARTYFLDWLSEYNAFYTHVGGANSDGKADALQQIKDYGIKDFDGISGDPSQGWQRIDNPDHQVAYEHTMYLDANRLRQFAADKFKWTATVNGARWDSTFEKWQFAENTKTPMTQEASSAATIKYSFWPNSENLFAVEWTYNSTSNTYARKMAGESHVDKAAKKQIEATNVIVMLQEESKADDDYHDNLHLLYKTTGSGEAYFFKNGKMIKATWSKSGRTARTKFFDQSGKEIPMERGKIWISIVPTYAKENIKVQ